MKGNLFMKSVLAFGILQAAVSNAGIFHTIIGPDGRPMVVQLPDERVLKKEPVKEGEPQKDAQQSEHASKDDLKQSNLKIESAVIAQPQEIRSSSQISRAQEQNLQQVIKKLDVKKTVPSVEERQQAKDNMPSIPPAQAADVQRAKPQKQDNGKAAQNCHAVVCFLTENGDMIAKAFQLQARKAIVNGLGFLQKKNIRRFLCAPVEKMRQARLDGVDVPCRDFHDGIRLKSRIENECSCFLKPLLTTLCFHGKTSSKASSIYSGECSPFSARYLKEYLLFRLLIKEL